MFLAKPFLFFTLSSVVLGCQLQLFILKNFIKTCLYLKDPSKNFFMDSRWGLVNLVRQTPVYKNWTTRTYPIPTRCVKDLNTRFKTNIHGEIFLKSRLERRQCTWDIMGRVGVKKSFHSYHKRNGRRVPTSVWVWSIFHGTTTHVTFRDITGLNNNITTNLVQTDVNFILETLHYKIERHSRGSSRLVPLTPKIFYINPWKISRDLVTLDEFFYNRCIPHYEWKFVE